MNQNNNKIIRYIAIAVIIIGIMIVIIGMILSFNLSSDSKFKDKEIEEKVEKNTEEIKSDISEELFPFYSEVIDKSNYFDLYLLKPNITDNNSLTPYDKTKFLLEMTCNDDTPQVTIQQLKEKMNEYFLPFDLYLGDIKGTKGTILYKYENGTYTYKLSEDSQYMIYTEEVSNIATNDSWILQKKVCYIIGKMVDNKLKMIVYADLDSKKEIASYESESNISIFSLPPEVYENIKDKLDTLTYNYKRNGNTYVLESITKS